MPLRLAEGCQQAHTVPWRAALRKRAEAHGHQQRLDDPGPRALVPTLVHGCSSRQADSFRFEVGLPLGWNDDACVEPDGKPLNAGHCRARDLFLWNQSNRVLSASASSRTPSAVALLHTIGLAGASCGPRTAKASAGARSALLRYAYVSACCNVQTREPERLAATKRHSHVRLTPWLAGCPDGATTQRSAGTGVTRAAVRAC